jgi:hypothetical protein
MADDNRDNSDSSEVKAGAQPGAEFVDFAKGGTWNYREVDFRLLAEEIAEEVFPDLPRFCGLLKDVVAQVVAAIQRVDWALCGDGEATSDEAETKRLTESVKAALESGGAKWM